MRLFVILLSIAAFAFASELSHATMTSHVGLEGSSGLMTRLQIVNPLNGTWYSTSTLSIKINVIAPTENGYVRLWIRETDQTNHIFNLMDEPYEHNYDTLGVSGSRVVLAEWVDGERVLASDHSSFVVQLGEGWIHGRKQTQDTLVQSQYEDLPYFDTDPIQKGELTESDARKYSMSIDKLYMEIRKGHIESNKHLRFLFAGSSTGKDPVRFKFGVESIGISSDLVLIDISEQALKIAKQSVDNVGLTNVSLIHGSFLDPQIMSKLGKFDFIMCGGVLHHLDNPSDGLRMLNSVLKDDGGMFLMVYGQIGRTGLYDIQHLMRILDTHYLNGMSYNDAQRYLRSWLTRYLEEMPSTSWFARNEVLKLTMVNFKNESDINDKYLAEIVDMFLHPRDQAYTVEGVYKLCESAGMKVTAFLDGSLYEPALYLNDPELSKVLGALPMRERYQAGEYINGNIIKHSFFAVKQSFDGGRASSHDMNAIPAFLGSKGSAETIRASNGVVAISGRNLHIPEKGMKLLDLIDGKKPLSKIASEWVAIMQREEPEEDDSAHMQQFSDLWGWLYPLLSNIHSFNLLLYYGTSSSQ